MPSCQLHSCCTHQQLIITQQHSCCTHQQPSVLSVRRVLEVSNTFVCYFSQYGGKQGLPAPCLSHASYASCDHVVHTATHREEFKRRVGLMFKSSCVSCITLYISATHLDCSAGPCWMPSKLHNPATTCISEHRRTPELSTSALATLNHHGSSMACDHGMTFCSLMHNTTKCNASGLHGTAFMQHAEGRLVSNNMMQVILSRDTAYWP